MHNRTAAGVLLCLFVALGTLLFATGAFAQFAENTGVIQGTVKDPTGAVVSGAEVTLSGPAIASRTITSDSAGFYRFPELLPGTYTVSVTAQGFRRFVRSGITVEVGKRLTQDIILELGSVTEVVEVTAEAAVLDTTSSKAMVNIPLEVLTQLPKGRSFLGLLQIAPGARDEPAQGGGEFQIDGASSAENNYTVEGMNFTNIQTGLTGANPPNNFFQEVTIKSSGYEAEHGGALGGTVNAVVRSGGLAWHGAAIFYFRHNNLDAGPRHLNRRNPALAPSGQFSEPVEVFDAKKDTYRIFEPGFEIGGPIIRDRLFFFGSYLPSLETLTRTIVSTNVNALGPRSFTRVDNVHNATGRLDWNATDKVRASATWVSLYRRARGTDLPSADGKDGEINAGAAVDPRTRRPDRGFARPNMLWRASGNWTPTPKLAVAGGFGIWKTDFQDRGLPEGIRYIFLAAATAGLGVRPQFRGPSGFSNIPSNTQTLFDAFERTQGDASVAYSFRAGGIHNLKGGFTLVRLANDVRRTTNFAQVNLEWGLPFTPNTPTEQQKCAPIIAARGSCIGAFGHYIVQDFQVRGSVASNNYGFFFQDSWTMGRGVTVNAGVRFDSEFLPSYGKGTGVVSKPIEFKFNDKVAPRLGAAWDVMQKGKVKVYGSWGWYYDIMKYELPRGSFGGDYWHDCAFTLESDDFNLILPAVKAGGFTCNNGTAGSTPGTFLGEEDFRIPSNTVENIDKIIDPNLKPMKQEEFILGGEWALTGNMGVTVRYARKRLKRAIEDVGILTPAGEEFLISNPGEGIATAPYRNDCPSSVAACAAAGVATDNLPPMPKATRHYDGVEVRFNKRFTGNWYLLASYTWSRLWGNFSGLASTDEDSLQRDIVGGTGRSSPNVNRAFDEQSMMFDANGKPVFGLLPTDRPHTFKAWGGYRLAWWGMSTTFSGGQFWYSGVPISSRILAVGLDAPFFPWGRGTFADITQDATGKWILNGLRRGARSPQFTNTDVNLNHVFKLSKTNEALQLVLEFNVLNIFNEGNVVTINDRTDRSRITDVLIFPDPSGAAGSGQNLRKFFNGFDPIAEVNAQRLRLESVYGKPIRIQSPRTIRVGMWVRF